MCVARLHFCAAGVASFTSHRCNPVATAITAVLQV
jgi:hypothetical protein